MLSVASRCCIQHATRRGVSSSLSTARAATIRSSQHLSTKGARRWFADVAPPQQVVKVKRPVSITPEERAALRAARKERATRALQAQKGSGEATTAAASSTDSSGTTGAAPTTHRIRMARWMWYLGVAVPTGLIVWGVRDENSPPARFSHLIGLSPLLANFAKEISKPSYDKLLPDWSQMPNVPQDIPVPHTLVLDLENTLVSSTWDRKYGWRHAKRPGVDQFLRTLAQYYEIVLYSPSIDGVAEPVVNSLDKEGCIMHRLYRDATHYHNGVHVKDLDRLNRNVNRIIVIDDDPAEVQFHPDNLLRVKPYTDPTDRTDNTLARITPFLLEVAREGYNDIPGLLAQYRGMDADEIANEQDRRIQSIRQDRERRSHRGLSRLVAGGGGGSNLPAPELPPSLPDAGGGSSSSSPHQLTAKDIAGQAPAPPAHTEGLMGWLDRRSKEKEEHQMRKMEKWNQVMMEKQRKRREAEKQQQAAGR